MDTQPPFVFTLLIREDGAIPAIPLAEIALDADGNLSVRETLLPVIAENIVDLVAEANSLATLTVSGPGGQRKGVSTTTVAHIGRDDPDFAAALEEWLGMRGFLMAPASSGKAA